MSRLIKSHQSSIEPKEQKVISIRMVDTGAQEESNHVYETARLHQATLLENAAREAEAIIAKAKANAEQVRQQIVKEKTDWEQEKALLTEEARSQGYEQGLHEGQKQGYAEYRQTILLARETVDASKRDYLQHIEGSEKVILELGLKVAGKILARKLSEGEEDFLHLVKRALKNARDNKNIQVHIHPVHFEFLLAQKEELTNVFPKEVELYIYPDDELTEEACIIESENGRIDASIDSQLEEIKRRLVELLEGENQ